MPLSNITTINLSLQSQGAAFVAREIAKLAQPARRLYVFGGASNVFPYFSTFANALTYANSLTPSTTNPVSIVLLSNSNGTPVEISGASDWYALCLAGINVSSPYREIFSTTTLPTTLPKGMRVMYVDANGVESLWVGDDSGVAVVFGGSLLGAFTPTFTVDGGTVSVSGQLVVCKVGSLCTITNSFQITGTTGSPFDPFTIGTIPAGFRPSSPVACIFINGNSFADGALLYPALIDAYGNIGVSVDFSTLPLTGGLLTIMAQYTTA